MPDYFAEIGDERRSNMLILGQSRIERMESRQSAPELLDHLFRHIVFMKVELLAAIFLRMTPAKGLL